MNGRCRFACILVLSLTAGMANPATVTAQSIDRSEAAFWGVSSAALGIAVTRATVSWLHGRQAETSSSGTAASAAPCVPIVLLHIPLP